jgi:protein-S-isoprenylcysteine O-methyltransferase Ste14
MLKKGCGLILVWTATAGVHILEDGDRGRVALEHPFLQVLAGMVVMVAMALIGREEAYLERNLAGAYLDYKSRVRRWL